MIVAIMKESDLELSDDLLEAIIDHVVPSIVLPPFFTFVSILFISNVFFLQTFADADSDMDGKISKSEWKELVMRNPSVLRNMTLPYLKYVLLSKVSYMHVLKILFDGCNYQYYYISKGHCLFIVSDLLD